jgi:protein tyrosine phosphatase
MRKKVETECREIATSLKGLFLTLSLLTKFPDQSKVLVHCSAGVGRTGTFLALYKLMTRIKAGEAAQTIDVFNEVFKLREDRCLMVKKKLLIVIIH